MKYSQLIPEHIVFALRFFIFPFLTFVLGKVLFELLAFNFFDLAPIQQASVIDTASSIVRLNEMKARLLWVTSAMVCFFITIGFGIFSMEYAKKFNYKININGFYYLSYQYLHC